MVQFRYAPFAGLYVQQLIAIIVSFASRPNNLAKICLPLRAAAQRLLMGGLRRLLLPLFGQCTLKNFNSLCYSNGSAKAVRNGAFTVGRQEKLASSPSALTCTANKTADHGDSSKKAQVVVLQRADKAVCGGWWQRPLPCCPCQSMMRSSRQVSGLLKCLSTEA